MKTFYLFFSFLAGSAMVLGGNSVAGLSTPISILISVILAIILYVLCFKIFKDKNIILSLKTGTTIDKFMLYALALISALGSLISILFLSYFIKIVSFQSSSITSIVLFITVSVIIMAYFGKTSIENYTRIIGFFLIILFLLSSILNIPQMDLDNLFPLYSGDLLSVLDNSFNVLALPFLEGLFLFFLYKGVYKKKPILISVIFSGILILISSMRNLMIFSYPGINSYYFPSYSALTLIDFSSFFQRTEAIVSIAFVVCYLVKSSIMASFTKNVTAYKYTLPLFGISSIISSFFISDISILFSIMIGYKNILLISFFIFIVYSYMKKWD